MICLIGQLNLKYLLTFKLVISHAKNVSAEGECHFYLSWRPPLPTCILKCVLQLRRSRAASTDLVQEFGCNDQKLCFFFTFWTMYDYSVLATCLHLVPEWRKVGTRSRAVQAYYQSPRHLGPKDTMGVKHSRPNCLLKHIHKCVTVSKKINKNKTNKHVISSIKPQNSISSISWRNFPGSEVLDFFLRPLFQFINNGIINKTFLYNYPKMKFSWCMLS